MAARGAGLPAPRVMHNAQGDCVTVTNAGFYVLSEYVAGNEYGRAQMPGPAAYQMGATLARLQDFLGKSSDVTPARLTEPAAAIGQLECLLAAAEARERPTTVDEVARHLLRYKIGALGRLADLFHRKQGRGPFAFRRRGNAFLSAEGSLKTLRLMFGHCKNVFLCGIITAWTEQCGCCFK